MTYESLGLRLPEIGRVKIGQKGEEKISQKGKKFQQPEKLDYFKIVTLGRGADNNLEVDQAAHEIYGEKPKKLVVRPISSKLEENIQAGYQLYSTAGVRLCFGDGQTGNQIDAQTGEVKTRACPCKEYDDNRCKKYAKANFFLDKVGGLGGVHTMTIRGRITVPALIGSLKYLTEVCDQAGGSIAGVALDLRMNEVMTKYGKVYSPYFLFPGTLEQLIAAAQKAVATKFRVLAEETDEADDTEEDQADGVEYPTAEETNGGTQDEEPASYGPTEPEKKPESPKTESKPKSDDKPKADDSSASPALKAFWCDACHKIVNDSIKPAVCKCGGNVWHECANMKAAQEAIAKRLADKPKSDPKLEPAPDKKVTVWCKNCYGIAEVTGKPRPCTCGKSHWVGAGSLDDAKKQIEEAKKAAEAAKPAEEPKTDRDKKILAISSGIKLIFGSSTTAAVLKQVSLLLDQQVEGSQYLCDQDVDDLVELIEEIKDMPKNDRDEFIFNWKQGRAAADAAEGAAA